MKRDVVSLRWPFSLFTMNVYNICLPTCFNSFFSSDDLPLGVVIILTWGILSQMLQFYKRKAENLKVLSNFMWYFEEEREMVCIFMCLSFCDLSETGLSQSDLHWNSCWNLLSLNLHKGYFHDLNNKTKQTTNPPPNKKVASPVFLFKLG